jgi:hypothetical protein
MYYRTGSKDRGRALLLGKSHGGDGGPEGVVVLSVVWMTTSRKADQGVGGLVSGVWCLCLDDYHPESKDKTGKTGYS